MLQRVVRVEARDRDGALIEGARFNIYINNTLTASTEGGNGFATVHVDNPKADIKVEALYDRYRREIRIAGNADVMPIRFPEVKYMPADIKSQHKFETVAFYCGIVFLLLAVVLAISIPNPTSFQLRVFTGFFSIAVGAFSIKLTGMLSVRMTFGTKVLISATGALAVFVLIYFFVPAQ
jgi:hypothetical protein